MIEIRTTEKAVFFSINGGAESGHPRGSVQYMATGDGIRIYPAGNRGASFYAGRYADGITVDGEAVTAGNVGEMMEKVIDIGMQQIVQTVEDI